MNLWSYEGKIHLSYETVKGYNFQEKSKNVQRNRSCFLNPGTKFRYIFCETHLKYVLFRLNTYIGKSQFLGKLEELLTLVEEFSKKPLKLLNVF